MSMTVLCVLRSGGDFRSEHVGRLRTQVLDWAPDAVFACLTDIPSALRCATRPIVHRWPGWWSKIELFGRVDRGRVVYLDLDSTVQGPLSRLSTLDLGDAGWAILRDVYRPHGLQSSVMIWEGDVMLPAFDRFAAEPERIMGAMRGDQDYLELCVREGVLPEPVRIQDAAPGAALSWKADIRRDGKSPDGAEVVFFHGPPRPWEV